MSRVLVIGDSHEPACHPMYLRFCQDLYESWDCNRVVHIGDLVDWHSISFHSKHPELPGPKDEFELAFSRIEKWKKIFPKLDLCIGNHDRRPSRLAEAAAVPEFLIRDYKTIWETPTWNWVYETFIDGVYYYHGEGCGGIHPAYNRAKVSAGSVVIGHIHSAAGVKWVADPHTRRFGMDVGTGIDIDMLQFAYGKHFAARPILSAGIVIDGVPYHEIMPVAPGEKYHKSRK